MGVERALAASGRAFTVIQLGRAAPASSSIATGRVRSARGRVPAPTDNPGTLLSTHRRPRHRDDSHHRADRSRLPENDRHSGHRSLINDQTGITGAENHSHLASHTRDRTTLTITTITAL